MLLQARQEPLGIEFAGQFAYGLAERLRALGPLPFGGIAPGGVDRHDHLPGQGLRHPPVLGGPLMPWIASIEIEYPGKSWGAADRDDQAVLEFKNRAFFGSDSLVDHLGVCDHRRADFPRATRQ